MNTSRRLFAIVALLAMCFAFALNAETVISSPPGLDSPIEFTNAPAASTNAIAIVELPPGFEQLTDLLPPKAKVFVVKVALWIGSLSLLIAPFATRLSHWLRDRLNRAASKNSAGKGMDAWLATLFANPIYKFFSVLLRFVNIEFPTTSDLERALKLQGEAVEASGGVASPSQKAAAAGSTIPMLLLIGCIAFAITGCNTTDKAAATATMTARTAATSFYDYYHLSTNAHPERIPALNIGLTNVMGASRRYGIAMNTYRQLSEAYQTNAALSNRVIQASVALSNNESNILWTVKFFKNQF